MRQGRCGGREAFSNPYPVCVKPIVVIYYLPEIFNIGGRIYSNNDAWELLSKYLKDYYVFCIPSNQSLDGSCEDLRLQVFHEKDFTEIQYKELKTIIEESINKIKNE